jgi:hypothetical protein|tara:strand:+ start:75 stop:287 length:213 start_codon:yes stop_codon:yes gene_type:complete
MNERQKTAMKETLVTVGTGLLINWPISIVLLYLFIDVLALPTIIVSILLTASFTIIATIRVFTIRMWFSK